jgi:polysaccharide export outer membrane protein
MTLEEAEAALFQRLLESQIDPTFSLEIAEFNSKRVSIGGAVGNPTVLPVGLLPVTLDQALTSVGGVTSPDVDYASIRIYRDGTLYQIPLRNYLETPSLQKTRLLGGDAVYVDTEFDLTRAQSYFSEQLSLIQFRQSSRSQARAELQSAMAEARSNFQAQAQFDAVDRDYVYLTGEVKTPSRFALPMGRTASLADALYEQGGFASEKANPAQIYVLRGSDNPAEMDAVTAFHLNAREAANFVLATRMQLRPNDVIFVAEQPITKWNRFIQQLTPSIITTTVSAVNN